MVTSKALSLFDNFNQLTPYAVGFDRVFDNLSRYVDNNATSTGYPPYNIRKEGDYNYVIEMALAGFAREDLEIEVADGVLTIRSVKEKSDDDVSNIYRGISYRKFVRKFTIADDIVVNGAKMENGMLSVDLERVVPEEKKPRLIEVK
jgi:molecular chaperone IbpA|tara:strand:+ start:22 stop:462 length:441 start_codon:yes stop_codon:yes gene_type:complete